MKTSSEQLHEAALELLSELLEQHALEPLDTAQEAELDYARWLVEELRRQWTELPGYVRRNPEELG